MFYVDKIIKNKLNIFVIFIMIFTIMISIINHLDINTNKYKKYLNICIEKVCVDYDNYMECIPFKAPLFSTVYIKNDILLKNHKILIVKVGEECKPYYK